jgi:hypothetical protein
MQAILRTSTVVFLLAAGACYGQVHGAANLTLNGTARIVNAASGNPLIQLTPAHANTSGSAFTANIVPFNPSMTFTTFFQFRMEHPGGIGSADGFTFMLQTESATALGGGGGGLGYANIAPSVAVEFDTWTNAPFDINDNHVAILTGGLLNDAGSQTPYGVGSCANPVGVFGCMANGDIWSVWIDYDGANINVALADNSSTRPGTNLISYPISLPAMLGQTSAYVGFTGATGSGWDTHEVLNWQFSETKAPF